MEKMFVFFGTFVALTINALLRGYVVSKLWLWFVVPTFELPKLTIVTAIGISLFSLLLNYIPKADRYPTEEEKKQTASNRMGHAMLYSILMSLFVLLYGWVVQLFM